MCPSEQRLTRARWWFNTRGIAAKISATVCATVTKMPKRGANVNQSVYSYAERVLYPHAKIKPAETPWPDAAVAGTRKEKGGDSADPRSRHFARFHDQRAPLVRLQDRRRQRRFHAPEGLDEVAQGQGGRDPRPRPPLSRRRVASGLVRSKVAFRELTARGNKASLSPTGTILWLCMCVRLARWTSI